jgi:hypothetical protein
VTQRVSFTVAEGVGSMTEAFSFAGGVSQGLVTNHAATGAVVMTVLGEMIGVASYSGGMRVGSTAAVRTVWQSSSSVMCMISQGLATTLRLTLTTAVEASSATEAVSYGKTVSVARRANGASTGSYSVTLYGSGLGQSDGSVSSRIGVTSSEASEWASDSCVRSLVGSGIAGTVTIAITAGPHAGSSTTLASYDVVTISSLSGNAPSTGSVVVTLVGAGLGMRTALRSAVLGSLHVKPAPGSLPRR